MSPSRAAGFAARQPLRVKLVATMVALLTLGLVVTGVAAWAVMRSYLVGQVDDNVASSAAAQVNQLQAPGNFRLLTNLSQAACPDENQPGAPAAYAFELSNSSGTLACSSTDSSGGSEPDFPSWTTDDARQAGGQPFTVGSVDGGGQWRAVAVVAPADTVFFLAASLTPVQHTLGQLILIEVIGGVVVVLLLGVLGYALVRRSLRPLVEVEGAAEDIAAGDLSRRVPELDPATEVGRLSRSFNTMVDRIETAFREREVSEAEARASEERMRRFVADASHELRTPLTSIRGFAELYRQGAVMSEDDISRVMRRIEDQATRMGLLVEDLLLLARLDQQRPLDLQPVDLLDHRQRGGPGRPRPRAGPRRHAGRRGRRAAAGRARRRDPAAAGGRQPHEQRADAHPGRHPGAGQHRDRRTVRPPRRDGPGTRHVGRRRRARVRALLPRGLLAGPYQRWDRPWPVDRRGAGHRPRRRAHASRPSPGHGATFTMRIPLAPAVEPSQAADSAPAPSPPDRASLAGVDVGCSVDGAVLPTPATRASAREARRGDLR